MADTPPTTVIDDKTAVAPPADAKPAETKIADAAKPAAAARPADKPADKAADTKATTIAADAGAADTRTAPATWPDDWRAQMAGDDKSALSTLERFGSPKAVFDSLREAQRKLSDRKPTVAKPAKDAPPEELKAWREANGIPETPDKYEIKLPDGLTLGADDKPMVDAFAKDAHATGMTNEQVGAAVAFYLKAEEDRVNGEMDEDQAHYGKSVETLQKEWGPTDYKRNIGAIRQIFADAPQGFEEQILAARMPNGRKIGGDAEALRFLAKLALDVVPTATLIPTGMGGLSSIEDRIASIEAIMRGPDSQKYWKDERMQAQYRDLLAAREKIKARGSKAA